MRTLAGARETLPLRDISHRPTAQFMRGLGPAASALLALVAAGSLVLGAGGAQAAATAVPLGTADSFAVLAGSGITNTGPTTLNGDIGTFPTTSVSGTSSLTITGTNHGGDAVAQVAKTDLVTAYDVAAGQGPRTAVAADLGGQTLTPGVYNSASSIGLTGALTLNGGGDPNAVFVFQAGSTLTTASASQVNLINGAQSCNVFWQVASSATLGSASTFRGTIIALTSITLTTGATVEGRVLARNGAVTLDTNTITKPTCAAAASSTTPTSTPAPTSAPAKTATSGAKPRPTSTDSQVTNVPSGSVNTGDSGRSGTSDMSTWVAGGAFAVAVGGALVVAARRRRHT